MNEQHGRLVVDSILRGAGDVLDALLSLVISTEVKLPEACPPETLQQCLDIYPVSFAVASTPGKGVALLLDTPTALALAARLQSKEAEDRDSLNDEDREVLAESLAVALREGLSRFMEDSGENPPNESTPVVLINGSEDIASLVALIGESSAIASVSLHSEPDFRIEGMLVYATAYELLVSAAPPEPVTQGNVLSPDEMNDILSGFGNASSDPMGMMDDPSPLPLNIDMVMDIRLRATARLGSVELPLGDVLSLGPGSIIDVGRLVDEPVDLLVNNKLIARGDVVVVDEKYGLRITEIVSPRQRIESLR